MIYRLVILNDCDAPEARMIALTRTDEGVCEWTYVSTSKMLSRWSGWNLAQRVNDHTEIALFGVRASLRVADGANILRIERESESRATYPDRVPRDWQRDLPQETAVRTHLVGYVAAVIAGGGFSMMRERIARGASR